MHRVAELKGSLIPDDIDIAVSRNYGETANDKANELLFHLGLATLSIVVLVAVAIGWREGGVVAIVIPVTILLTLFASWLMGYTINRVSLFALIFSIGILVDDAIVVIENIARHWGMRDGRSRTEAAIQAVAEVGNPTIVATLTVVAALLPMLFVSGLMGPYMSPIPANASAAMVLSFFVAMIITPWLMMRFGKAGEAHDTAAHGEGWLARIYVAVARPILATKRTRMDFLAHGRPRDACSDDALCRQSRDGEALALRRQIRASGRHRSSRRLFARGDGSRALSGCGPLQRLAGVGEHPVLCGNGRSIQFQRPRAALLSAQRAAAG